MSSSAMRSERTKAPFVPFAPLTLVKWINVLVEALVPVDAGPVLCKTRALRHRSEIVLVEKFAGCTLLAEAT
ncbi:hypothetical protein FH972_025557 [Carpinus fangiana]|uniref:Uncharacterized protein n=1 Tax=Carpinus fangiana TaxID=176857 RepID=A0A5N6L1D3_9ROSI|nr:hypothetical protein FH972_025557 [Carpinus fangiana]